MIIRFLVIAALALYFVRPTTASALTVEQFFDICDSVPGECSAHPTLHAYVGGALDLLATLDEQTDYLADIYCGEPKALFDVPAIIRFMQTHREGSSSRNAMLLVVRYFEKNGGCAINE